VAAPPVAQLAGSSFVGVIPVIPRVSDWSEGFPYSGEWRAEASPDEWVTFRMRPRNSIGEIRADVASALNERWEQGTCHYGDIAFQA
jgi:hypothetical protein